MSNLYREQDLYRDAVVFGTREWEHQTLGSEEVDRGEATSAPEAPTGPATKEYRIARHAARGAAIALLMEAKRVGISEEHREALRHVAADVAYD